MRTKLERTLKCGYSATVTMFKGTWLVDIHNDIGYRMCSHTFFYRSDLRKVAQLLIDAADKLGRK